MGPTPVAAAHADLGLLFAFEGVGRMADDPASTHLPPEAGQRRRHLGGGAAAGAAKYRPMTKTRRRPK
jgi:hypothetical protein